jgi:hypothetical protein
MMQPIGRVFMSAFQITALCIAPASEQNPVFLRRAWIENSFALNTQK